MTTIIAINGSPRKKWNTAILLEKAIEGAVLQGAETELLHLYDLNYEGCTSCFACKIRGGKSYGKCVMQDDLTTVLDRIKDADAIILGSPIYFGSITGKMRCFMERLIFPYLVYTNPLSSNFTRKIRTAFIYTMNVSEQQMKDYHINAHTDLNEHVLARTFGFSESICSFETLQFEDFSKVVYFYADPEVRKERRRTIFPHDCEKVFELGARFAMTGRPV